MNKFDKSLLAKLKRDWRLGFFIILPIWIGTVIAMITTAILSPNFALFICIAVCMLFSTLFIMTLAKYVTTMRIEEAETLIIDNGQIIEGRVVNFTDDLVELKVGVSISGVSQTSMNKRDTGGFNTPPTWNQARSAVYEYQDGDGKTIQNKSPAYLSDKDKIEIIQNSYRVLIAVYNKKSCIYGL